MHLSVNKAAAFIAAIAAPCLTLLVDQHLLTPLLATDVGAVIFTAVAFLHINNDEARAALAALAPTVAVAPLAPNSPADVLSVDPAMPSAL